MTEVPLDRLSSDLPPDDLPGVLGDSSASAKAPPRQLVFAIVATALFMCSVDLTIVATALPAIHRGLHASINWVGWTITIYGLAMVVAFTAQPMGSLGPARGSEPAAAPATSLGATPTGLHDRHTNTAAK